MAANADTAQVRTFVANTAGKVFEPTVINGEWGLSLVSIGQARNLDSPDKWTSGTSLGATQKSGPILLPKCWQAWVAAYAWYVGTGAICGAIGLGTFVAGGFICAAAVWTSGMVINWNNACK